MTLRSQKLRQVNAQADSLKLGMGWSPEDLGKPQILVESCEGETHPGSYHLGQLAEEARNGLLSRGMKPVSFFATDICDGIAQSHEGMDFSLPSREILAHLVEIHAQSHQHDGMVLISTCDKAIPAHLIASARVNIPAVLLPGGSMDIGPGGLTENDVAGAFIQWQKGAITEERFREISQGACPSCGACQFMGTASTMQVLTEAMGMCLPGAALAPAGSNLSQQYARKTGEAIAQAVENNLCPRDIITEKSLVNALVVHAAVGGSTNALLHLPALAYELGLPFPPERVNEINAKVPYLANILPGGKHPARFLWYAGGVPRLLLELKEFLHLDALTVTGKTLEESLGTLEKSGFFDRGEGYLKNYGLRVSDVIGFEASGGNTQRHEGNSRRGSVAILKGSLAPEGAVIKYSAFSPELYEFTGPAAVFDREEEAYRAIIEKKVEPGSVIVIRYEGPRATGMPELYLTTRAVCESEELAINSILVTDGRFSGATFGPAIGHISPEAMEGGPIALVENGDLIRFSLSEMKLDIVGLKNAPVSPAEVEQTLAMRRQSWRKPEPKYRSGVMGLYTRSAASAMDGAYMR